MREQNKESKLFDESTAVGLRIGIIASKFNSDIVEPMLESAIKQLHGALKIEVVRVPGAFEIPVAAKRMAVTSRFDGILTLGCVIKGGTDHYEHICRSCADGITCVAVMTGVPIMFGVLTVHNREDAIARINGAHADMGKEAATSLIETIRALQEL